MSQKMFNKLMGFLFGAKAVFGVFYLLSGWQVTISGWLMPLWLMVVAVVVDAYLAYTACGFGKKGR